MLAGGLPEYSFSLITGPPAAGDLRRRFSPYGTAFLTEAIIVQRYTESDSRLERIMAVVKVRASAHSDELHLLHNNDDGIQIGEMVADREGLPGGTPSRRS